MINNKVLGIILGGGQGSRLYPLTKDRSKPAVPIAGKYRLVDIPISNCINSDIKRMYVLTQFNSASLNKHIKGHLIDLFKATLCFIGTVENVMRIGKIIHSFLSINHFLRNAYKSFLAAELAPPIQILFT